MMGQNSWKMKNQKCIVIFSGGQDSSTTAGWAKASFKEVQLLAFDYNQRHKIELTQAKIIAQKLNLPLHLIPISSLDALAESALFMHSCENLSAAHAKNPRLPASFVPNRNALFITLAHAFAQKLQAQNLALGVSEADYSGYPDCRREFIDLIQNALNLGSDTQITIHTPLEKMSKKEEFALAKELGILEIILEDSHTCYEGDRSQRHVWGYGCGICPACILRKRGWEAFIQESRKAKED